MKRIFSLLLLAMLSHLYVAAKLEGSGYYRIWNAAILAKNKEKAYCCVSCDSYYMNTSAGTDQKIASIPLYPEQYSFTDPSAIIYVQMPDATHKFDLSAQGVWVSQLLDGSSLTLSGNTDGNYVLTGKVKGVETPVYSTSRKSGIFGPKYYVLTSSNSDTSYKFWGADKVDSESDKNYFGVKPTLSAKGKYYAPFYVSFPFETASDGMKVYYVSKMNKSGYTLEEINGIIPAATPVLIECSSDDPSKNRLKLHEPGTRGVRVADNKLKGVYFCNPNLEISQYSHAATEFKAETMRIWKVVNDELVLSNDGSTLVDAEYVPGVPYLCLNANQSYLPVPADYATTMKEGQADPVTVTFLNDEGGILTTVEGFPGDKITLPAEPTKTGYTFAGWEGLADVFPEESKTVKPMWTINQYTITFDSDGGNEVAPVTQNYGTAVAIPATPTKTGHTFLGWEPELPQTMPAGDLTVKALWKANAYTITFDAAGGSAVSPITADYNTAITAPSAPVKEGYTFLGWEPELPKTMPLDGMTVKAKWQINQYTIKFNCDGGSAVSDMTQDYGTAVSAPDAPTKFGYTFAGWEPELPATVPAQNITVKAVWQAAKTSYDISLSEGWNWVSIPMMDEDMTGINTLLRNGEWELGDEVKSKTAVAAYSKRNAKWLGALAHQTKLSGTVMYKIRSAKTQGVALKEGRVTVPAEMNVTVNGGWNHISYLPAEPMLLSEALANYPAADGDVIKSETASSLYSNDKGWEGELTVLEPEQGYMLMRNAGNPVTFRYPNEAQTKVEEQPTAGTANRYADNMTVVATLAGVETEVGDSLAAIVRGEIRGTSAVSEDGTTILTVQGIGAELVSIALLRGGEVFATANTSLCYEVDAVVGSLGNPAAISFVEDDDTALPFNGGNVAAIYSADGKKVNTTNYNSLPAGTYIVYAVADGKTNIIKTTKK